MLTHRVIPCLDVNQGRVVKGVNFVDLRDAGDRQMQPFAYLPCGPVVGTIAPLGGAR